VWVPKNVVDTAGDLAELAQITRTKLLSNIIELNVNSLNNARKVGFIHFIVVLRDIGDKLKNLQIDQKEIDAQENIENLQDIVDSLVKFLMSKTQKSDEENENELKGIIEKIKNY
jgi:hypothetical protein